MLHNLRSDGNLGIQLTTKLGLSDYFKNAVHVKTLLANCLVGSWPIGGSPLQQLRLLEGIVRFHNLIL